MSWKQYIDSNDRSSCTVSQEGIGCLVFQYRVVLGSKKARGDLSIHVTPRYRKQFLKGVASCKLLVRLISGGRRSLQGVVRLDDLEVALVEGRLDV